MVKKPWDKFEQITTPSALKDYIEACKEWIIQPAADDVEESFSTIQWKLSRKLREDTLGLMPEDIAFVNHYKCALCKTSCPGNEKQIMKANPFTRAQYMLVCKECHQKF